LHRSLKLIFLNCKIYQWYIPVDPNFFLHNSDCFEYLSFLLPRV
jgi:hypothetical protein